MALLYRRAQAGNAIPFGQRRSRRADGKPAIIRRTEGAFRCILAASTKKPALTPGLSHVPSYTGRAIQEGFLMRTLGIALSSVFFIGAAAGQTISGSIT